MAVRSPSVLILDDDASTLRVLAAALLSEGFEVVPSMTLAHAESAIVGRSFDLYLIDLMLPDGDGLDFCATLRERTRSPIIIITARTETRHVVEGFDVGADDYIRKPFKVAEVVARVHAKIRRGRSLDAKGPDASRISLGDMVVDLTQHAVSVGGRPVSLGSREFSFLSYLALRAGRPIRRDALVGAIWRDAAVSSKVVEVCVRRLRMKIEDDPSRPKRLVTVRDYGYLLTKPS